MTARLREIRERAEQATDGPWFIVGPPWNEGAPFVNAGSADPHGGEVVCDFTYMAGDDSDWGETNNSEANAAFIAAARADIPWLLAELERTQETLREARAFVAGVDLHGADAVFPGDVHAVLDDSGGTGESC